MSFKKRLLWFIVGIAIAVLSFNLGIAAEAGSGLELVGKITTTGRIS